MQHTVPYPVSDDQSSVNPIEPSVSSHNQAESKTASRNPSQDQPPQPTRQSLIDAITSNRFAYAQEMLERAPTLAYRPACSYEKNKPQFLLTYLNSDITDRPAAELAAEAARRPAQETGEVDDELADESDESLDDPVDEIGGEPAGETTAESKDDATRLYRSLLRHGAIDECSRHARRKESFKQVYRQERLPVLALLGAIASKPFFLTPELLHVTHDYFLYRMEHMRTEQNAILEAVNKAQDNAQLNNDIANVIEFMARQSKAAWLHRALPVIAKRPKDQFYFPMKLVIENQLGLVSFPKNMMPHIANIIKALEKHYYSLPQRFLISIQKTIKKMDDEGSIIVGPFVIGLASVSFAMSTFGVLSTLGLIVGGASLGVGFVVGLVAALCAIGGLLAHRHIHRLKNERAEKATCLLYPKPITDLPEPAPAPVRDYAADAGVYGFGWGY